MLISTMMLLMTCRNSAPITTPNTLPRPPDSDVPPSTTIVITSNSRFSPMFTLPESVLAVRPSAPIQDSTAHTTNASTPMNRTFMPDSLLASALPPTAKKPRPMAVYLVNIHRIIAISSISTTGNGMTLKT